MALEHISEHLKLTIKRSADLIAENCLPLDIRNNNPAMLHACKRGDLATVFALYEGGFRAISQLQRKGVLGKLHYQETWSLGDITGIFVPWPPHLSDILTQYLLPKISLTNSK